MGVSLVGTFVGSFAGSFDGFFDGSTVFATGVGGICSTLFNFLGTIFRIILPPLGGNEMPGGNNGGAPMATGGVQFGSTGAGGGRWLKTGGPPWPIDWPGVMRIPGGKTGGRPIATGG